MKSYYAILIGGILLYSACQSKDKPITIQEQSLVGEVSDTRALVQVRLTPPDSLLDTLFSGTYGWVRVMLQTDTASDDYIVSDWHEAVPARDFIVKIPFKNLQPGMLFYYQVEYGPSLDQTKRHLSGSFQTLPGAKSEREVALHITSCMNFGRFQTGFDQYGELTGKVNEEEKKLGYPALQTLSSQNPRYWIAIGDNVYYDFGRKGRENATDSVTMRVKWHEQFYQPRFEPLLSQVACYFLKDDHDYRFNDADTTGDRAPSHALGKAMFLEQIPMQAFDADDQRTYRTYRVNKNLQIWMVEGRDYRSPNKMEPGPGKTIWGEQQKSWLKRTLLESDAHFKILISPTPMIGPDDAYKIDNHTNPGGFTHERDAFFAWVQENLELSRFFVVCGDRHWQYHSEHPIGIEEFSAGALVEANSRPGRISGDPDSTDPEGEIKQYYVQGKGQATAGFLKITQQIYKDLPQLEFSFFDEHGELLYNIIRE